MKRVVAVLVGSVLFGLLALPLSTGTASAVPSPPTLVAPADGASGASNPVLQWNPVTDAVRYRVQVSENSSFTSVVYSADTYNTYATPPSDLRQVTHYWRVASIDSGGAVSGWSVVRSYTKTPPVGPTLISPLNAANLNYPDDPLLFSWQPVTGAKAYEIEIDDSPGFVSPIVKTQTSNTAFTLTDPVSIDVEFRWRVKAIMVNNQNSQLSEERTFTVRWPNVVSPITPPDSAFPPIDEVVFAWNAVPGAVSYDVEVGTDQDFTQTPVLQINTKATRLAPQNNFNNGSYFWRVRARGMGTAVGPWSTPRQFTKTFIGDPTAAGPGGSPDPLKTITLLTPANNDFAVRTQLFSWTPLRWASTYEIQFATDVNFSPAKIVRTCRTNHTELIPNDRQGCSLDFIVPGNQYWWRVRGLDGPSNWLSGWTAPFTFIHDPGRPNQTAPANGATVQVPILQWDPVPDFARYRVKIKNASGSVVKTVDTHHWTYVPDSLPLDPDGSTDFTWTVVTLDTAGNPGVEPLGSWRAFTVQTITGGTTSPDPITPLGSGDTMRLPLLQWQAVAGATAYEIWYGPRGTGIFQSLVSNLKFPAWAEPDVDIAPGQYDWYVRATTPSGMVDGALGWVEVFQAQVTTLTAPPHCPPSAPCTALADTPMMEWVRDPQAMGYRVQVAADALFTNIIYEVKVRESRVLIPDSLPESQPGQALYWYARPCYDPPLTICGPEPATFAGAPGSPVRAFRKQSKAIELMDPPNGATGPTVANDIRLDWRDFLETNQYTGAPVVTQEARQYRVQVAAVPDFATLVDNVDVNMTEYTAWSKTYPDGPLYWRVAAIDGSGNALTFSPVRTMTKASPQVVPTAPAPGATVSSVPVLQWQAQNFAASYEVEIYTNVGAPLSTANRVYQRVTRYTAAIPTNLLAPGTYGWRVRRLDADNRPGPWTADNNAQLRLFTIQGDAPALVAPNDGQVLQTNALLYDWNASIGATQYRIKVSTSSSFSSLLENQTTVMTEWAPTINYPDGTYYWKVEALDASNNVLATSVTRSFVKYANTDGDFYPVKPYRLLDTRTNNTPLVGGVRRDLVVTGVAGSEVPANGVSAVVMNVTVTGPTMGSHLTVWPYGGSIPNVSNLNFVPGQTVPNLVVVKTGTDGRTVSFQNFQGTVHLIVDIVGYYSNGTLEPGSRFTPTSTPTRILDTRTTTPPSPWARNESRPVPVAGIGEVPDDATAIVVNTTVTGPTGAGYLTLYPDDAQPPPTASNLNFVAGQTVPNLVMVKIGPNRNIRILNGGALVGTTHVILDVVGYYKAGMPPPGSRYKPIPPARILDTRQTTKLQANEVRQIQVAGQGGVPSMSANPAPVAVIMNVTVTGPLSNGHLTVFPSGVSAPNASNLNFVAGQTVPNLVVVRLGPDGKVQITSPATVDVIFDVVGWFQAPT